LPLRLGSRLGHFLKSLKARICGPFLFSGGSVGGRRRARSICGGAISYGLAILSYDIEAAFAFLSTDKIIVYPNSIHILSIYLHMSRRYIAFRQKNKNQVEPVRAAEAGSTSFTTSG